MITWLFRKDLAGFRTVLDGQNSEIAKAVVRSQLAQEAADIAVKRNRKLKDRIRDLETNLERILAESDAVLIRAETAQSSAKAAENRSRRILAKAGEVSPEQEPDGADGVRVPEAGEVGSLEGTRPELGAGDNSETLQERGRRIMMSRGR